MIQQWVILQCSTELQTGGIKSLFAGLSKQRSVVPAVCTVCVQDVRGLQRCFLPVSWPRTCACHGWREDQHWWSSLQTRLTVEIWPCIALWLNQTTEWLMCRGQSGSWHQQFLWQVSWVATRNTTSAGPPSVESIRWTISDCVKSYIIGIWSEPHWGHVLFRNVRGRGWGDFSDSPMSFPPSLTNSALGGSDCISGPSGPSPICTRTCHCSGSDQWPWCHPRTSGVSQIILLRYSR